MESISQSATLLILTSREEEAEGLIKSLRNGGLAVQGIFTDEPKRLEELASTGTVKLILCCEYDSGIDLDTWISQYCDLELDVPLVIIAADTRESPELIAAMRSGARDMTKQGDTDHLQLVVARELSDYEHRRNESRLRERMDECEKRSRDLVDATGEAVAFIKEGIHVQVNPAYQELYGFASADDIEGFPLLDLIGADFHRQVGDTLRSVERDGGIGPTELDIQCIRPDDERFDVHLTASRSMLEGEPCVRVMVEGQRPKLTPSSPGSVDPDTGLPNRTALMQELESRVAEVEAQDTPFAVIYVGINIYPMLLQDRGLTGGLMAAARFAEYLRDLVPQDAFLARAGDDGYVLLVNDLEAVDAERLIATIKEKARLPIELDSQGEDVPQCSAGLALVDSISDPPDKLLDSAYRNYVFGMLESAPGAPPATTEDERSKGNLEKERRIAEHIQHALDVDGFRLFYQPIVSLKGDRQESYSVLPRLLEDDGTLLDTEDFLDAAISSGTASAVDRWVIRNAIATLATQRSKGQEVNFFVGITEQSLQEEKLLIWVCDCLRELEARGNWLTLQVLEKHARNHAAAFTKLSDGLRTVSCRVALDHFGEGKNPEMLLRNLHLDHAMFSPDLGQGLADDRLKQRRLQELTKLCRSAGVKSVVTGVEDARSLTVLWTAGIDYVQGSFLQEPSPEIDQARRA